MFWARLLNQPIMIWLFGAALVLFGSAAALDLPVRSSPIIPYRYVDISTNLAGGDVLTIDRFVTLPLETQVEQLPGIKYVTGFTMAGNSDINAFLADGASADTVYSQVLAAEDSVRANLPPDVQAPAIKLVGDPSENQEFGLAVMVPPGTTPAAVSGYVYNDLIGRLATVPGIGPISISSGAPKMRIDFDPLQMIAQNVTPISLANALGDVGAISPTGVLRNDSAMMPVVSATGPGDLGSFDTLPIFSRGAVTGDLQTVGAANIGFNPGTDISYWNGGQTVFINAGVSPAGNIFEVSDAIRTLVASAQQTAPPGVHLIFDYDESDFVARSLTDLALTLVATIFLVAAIVRLSLGTMRASLAPLAAILLSLLGAVLVMQLTGQSLNLFTIIALVLAVGLVVDDAIVVSEDIFRQVAEGNTPLQAAQTSVTHLAPVLAAISSTLIIAFLPLGFLSGLTAVLFRPFALVLCAAFLFSLIIALTVVPSIAMWASRGHVHKAGLNLIDHLRGFYIGILVRTLRFNPLVGVGVGAVAVACLLLAQFVPKNFAPAPDGLYVALGAQAANGASMKYVLDQQAVLEKLLHRTFPGQPDWLDASEMNNNIDGGYTFATPNQAAKAVVRLTAAFQSLTGLSAYASQDSGLPGDSALPVSVNISGQVEPEVLLDVANKIQTAANNTGDFDFIQINPGPPQYEYEVHVNRLLCAQLGISNADVRSTIADALSGNNLGEVQINGGLMNIVMAAPDQSGPEMVESLPIETGTGRVIPLGTVVNLIGTEQANMLDSWQGLPSVNIQAQQKQGVALSRALSDLRAEFAALNTHRLSFSYTGPSETYAETGRQNVRLFELGLVGLFFLLAAQFQSLRDPFVVITTVPLASAGPLLLCVCGGATLNIVTEIALLTVWGLIARQGILFVQIAHEGRNLGLPLLDTVERAASLRFRPIIMITLALIGGSIPLMLATGPQATIRYDLGAILATGMGSGFILSLFTVPAMYCLMHRGSHG